MGLTLRRYDRLFERIEGAVYAVGLVYCAAFALFPHVFGALPHQDEPMALSGFVLILLAVPWLWHVQSRFPKLVSGLAEAGAIGGWRGDTDDHADHRERRCRAKILIFAVLASVLTIGILTSGSNRAAQPHLLLGAILAAVLISGRFGDAVAAGLFATALRRGRLSVHLNPFAADKAAGLQALGDYYFQQALFLAIPAAYMLFWIIAIEAGWLNAEVYGTAAEDLPAIAASLGFETGNIWLSLFALLLIINLVIFNLAVFLPARAVGRAMLRYKLRHIEPQIAVMSEGLIATQRRLIEDGGAARLSEPERSAALAALTEQSAQIARLRRTPTGPIPLSEILGTLALNAIAIAGLLETLLS